MPARWPYSLSHSRRWRWHPSPTPVAGATARAATANRRPVDRERDEHADDTAYGPAFNDPTAFIADSGAATQYRQAWSEGGFDPEPVHHDGSWRVTWHNVALITVAALAVAGVAALVGTQLRSPSSTPTAATSPPVTVITQPPVTVFEAPPVTVTPTPTTTPAPEVDTESTAEEQLHQYAVADKPTVTTDLWVPQLSSKHAAEPWTYDKEDGLTYDSSRILREHQRLRREYGAILLWSGAWPGYTERNDWVTIVPSAFRTSDGAIAWCANHGFDSDHCYAEDLYDGRTAYH